MTKLPCGIEILLKKSVVDAGFRKLLLDDPEAAARSIELELEPVELALLRSMPTEQIRAVIDRTEVPNAHRRAFLGKTAALMIAVMAGAVPMSEKEATAQFNDTPVQDSKEKSDLRQPGRGEAKGDPKNAGRIIEWNPDEHEFLQADAPRKPMTIRLDENGEIPLNIRLRAAIARSIRVPYDELMPETPIPYGRKGGQWQHRSVAEELRGDFGMSFDVKIPMRTLKSLDTVAEVEAFVMASLEGYDEEKRENPAAQEPLPPPILPWNRRNHMAACGGIRADYLPMNQISQESLQKDPWQGDGGRSEVRCPNLGDIERLVYLGMRKGPFDRARKTSYIQLPDELYSPFRRAIYRRYGVRMPMETLKSLETTRQLNTYLTDAWTGVPEPPNTGTTGAQMFGDDFGRF